MGTNSQRIDALERNVGSLLEEMGGPPTLLDRVQNLERYIQDVLPRDTSGNLSTLLDRIQALEEGLQTLQGNPQGGNFGEMIDEMRDEIHRINQKLTIVSMAVANSPVGGGERTKMKVPEPKAFIGVRDARELENFIFDMEQYFRATKVDTEETKVSTASMYLSGDAKLWWRNKYKTFKLVIARSTPRRT